MKRSMSALVIGNGAYLNGGVLRNPVNDASDVSAKLTSYGFQVIEVTDATNKEIDNKLKEFKSDLASADVGLFFFAGHGVQIEGQNFLLAVDTETGDETDVKYSSLALNKVIDTMEKSNAATKIIILDACRDNPWERAWTRSTATRGLASVYAPKGTIIGFATSPGEIARDGSSRNGSYTGALLEHIDTPDCAIENMFKRVRNSLAAETRGKQTSWEHTSLSGDFFFNLSLGKLVTAYKSTSLADAMFTINQAFSSHKIIQALKSHDWYVQNPAVNELNAAAVNKMSADTLFVIGRNLYQAACGGSRSAKSFIHSFTESTTGFDLQKRKALLDGILFEIFFDPHATLRQSIKGNLFDEVFGLSENDELKESFEFISHTLLAARGSFYVLPGRGHELAVTVAAKKVKVGYLVEQVYVGGENVLKVEDKDDIDEDGKPLDYGRRCAEDLKEQLSQELIVPSPLLKISYTPGEAAKGVLLYPSGYTVKKS